MAIIYKCDKCGKEIHYNEICKVQFKCNTQTRIEELKDISNNNFNDIDLCKNCVIEVVKRINETATKIKEELIGRGSNVELDFIDETDGN